MSQLFYDVYELIADDFRKVRWGRIILLYACVTAILGYVFFNYEMWFLSAKSGLVGTVLAILLFASLVTNFLSLGHGLVVVCGAWTVAIVATMGWIHGLESPNARLWFLVAKAVSSGYILGLLIRIARGLRAGA